VPIDCHGEQLLLWILFGRADLSPRGFRGLRERGNILSFPEHRSNAITTAQVIQGLIELAKDIRGARQRSEEEGLSEEKIAFYDALAENESAVQVIGDE